MMPQISSLVAGKIGDRCLLAVVDGAAVLEDLDALLFRVSGRLTQAGGRGRTGEREARQRRDQGRDQQLSNAH